MEPRQNQEIPFQISFRNFPTSDAVWLDVQQHVEKLERFQTKVLGCEVVLSAPHQHEKKAKIFHVEIRLKLPGDDIFITREPGKDLSHTDIYIAIRDAFRALERRLEDHIRIRRGFVKTHENGGYKHELEQKVGNKR